MLNKEQILAVRDIKIEELFVPEWEGSIYIKTMTAEERGNFDNSVYAKGEDGLYKTDLIGMRAKMCAIVICDADGKQLFTAKDVEALLQKSGAALARIYERAQELAATKEGAVEEAIKN